MNLDDISIVIPIKDDTSNLLELLRNVTKFGFNDIHVVDSNANSQNQILCQQAGAKYVTFAWNGCYPKKRNWYLSNASLRDWVFFLDSDERLTTRVVSTLKALNGANLEAIAIQYNNTFLGRKLRYGDVMTKIPLMRNHIRFERIAENNWSVFDMEIHEHPIVAKNRICHIASRIEHLEKTSIERYLSKHNNYSNWEASRLSALDHNSTRSLRLRTKYRLLRTPFAGTAYFFYAFVLKMGFLDGRPGFILAKLKSQYFYWIYIKTKYETR